MIRRLLALGALFGGLLLPSLAVGDDFYSAGAANYGANRFTVDLFGHNNAVETSEESLWSGDDASGEDNGPLRCFDNMIESTVPTAKAIFMSSDDEADAGEVVTVHALDANWDPVTIEVTLGVTNTSSTTNVQIGTANLMRINRAFVAGRTAVVGTIYLHLDTSIGTDGLPDDVPNHLVAVIDIGTNETQMACYSVPNNYTAFLSHICMINDSINGGTEIQTYRLRASVDGQITRVRWGPFEIATLVQHCQEFIQPLSFGEKTDIELTAVSTDNSTTATMGLILVKNGQSLTGR